MRYDRATGRFVTRLLSDGHKAVNQSIATLRGRGERAKADLKNWRVLGKVRCSQARATRLANAVQAVVLNN